jgi:galactonate dehydratase
VYPASVPEITDYECYNVPPRWLFLRVETSDGRVGWGEPIVEGRTKTTRTAVEELFETYLLGKDPADIEDHWQEMYRGGFYRGGPVLMSAISGVDQALWDLKGKEHGAPVYDLLGGPVRDRIQLYQGIGGGTPEECAEKAQEGLDAGFSAFKMAPFDDTKPLENPGTIDRAAERVGAVRETVGGDAGIAIDCHGRINKTEARRVVDKMEPHDLMFVEEPLLPEHLDSLDEVAAATTAPIATGERLYSRQDFKPLLESGALDVAQPDLSHAGGITECKKIADMCAAYDVAVAPHCPLGPVALASCFQIDAACHNAVIQEQGIGLDYTDSDVELLEYMENPEAFYHDDGYVDLPEGDGLGVELDVDLLEERDQNVDFHNAVWRNDDGSVTEW